MIIDLAAPPKIRREPYLEYEFVADLDDGGAKILFNDPTLSYNHLVALEIGDKLLRFQLVGAQPTTTIPGDDYLIYPSVLPNIDLCYDLYAGRLKETLVINSAQAQHEFSFDLETNGVTASLQPDNSIVYKDAADNVVWTINAPFSVDANGATVETYLQFSDGQYIVGVSPATDAAYPIRVDPTVTLPSAYIWNAQGNTVTVTLAPYRLAVGRADGSRPIPSLTVYNQRKYGSTYYTATNTTNASTKYQFFDKDNVAVSEQFDFAVDSVTYIGSISVPSNAYTIEFVGVANGSASFPVTNILQLKTAECAANASHWDFTQKVLPYYTDTAVHYSVPKASFNSSTSGQAVSETYDAPFGTTFTAGSISVSSERSPYSYIKDCYVDLYTTDGTLYGSTSIPYPSTAPGSGYNTRGTTVTVPAGIARITLRGTKYTASTAIYWPTVYFNVGTSVPEYGTAKYALTLTSDVQDIPISPGFVNLHPANPFKTYVCYGADVPGNYVESSTVTGVTGAVANIKVSLTANETARPTTAISNICLASSPYTSANLTVDSKRCIAQTINLNSDTVRSLLASANSQADTSRSTVSGQTAYADSMRQTLADTTAFADTKRQVSLLHSANALIDALRKVIKSSELITDTKRATAKYDSVTSDTLRKTLAAVANQFDISRNTLAAIILFTDAKRSLAKSVLAAADTARGLSISVLVNADTKRGIGVALSGLVTVDTVRAVIKNISGNYDSTRRIAAFRSASADTKRRLAAPNISTSDLTRRIGTAAQTNADTGRKINAVVINRFDSSRKLKGVVHAVYDTKRVFGTPLILIFDTKRTIKSGIWPYIKRHELNIQIQNRRITILSFTD